MDKLPPVGTLVRVRDDALAGEGYAEKNRQFVEKHGYLHFVVGSSSNKRFRSLSTGRKHAFFFPDEIEEAPTDE